MQHVTVLNTTGNCNTVVSICVSKHRNNTVKIWYMEFAGLEVALDESVSEW